MFSRDRWHFFRLSELSVFTKPVRTALQTMSNYASFCTSPATRTSCRRGNRTIYLIFALLLLHTFTTAGWAQLPAALAETSAPPTLAPLVRKVLPSVVSITVRIRAPVQEPLFIDPESRQFPDGPCSSTDREIKAAGVVVDAQQGLIVTNSHVIEHADDISVTLADGRRLEGSRIDADPDTDIAVIGIAAADLVALPMGNSDTLEVGD